MPKIADLIEIRIIVGGEGHRYEIRIDGEVLPWYTNGLSWASDKNSQPEVTITIPARFVDVEHQFG